MDRFHVRAGERVRQLRQERGLSQQALANQAGVLRTSITNIEAGRQHLVTETCLGVAAALDVPPSALLGGTKALPAQSWSDIEVCH